MTATLLLSLLIKSSFVAGAGLACARFLAQRAVDRVDILRGTVCLLLALPVIMNVLPAMDLALLPRASPDMPPGISPAWTSETKATGLSWPPSVQLIGGLWLLGVVAVAGRLQLGLLTLHRWTREGRPVTCAQWTAPLEDLSPADRPRLVSSDRIDSPLSWGVAPGFIVIDSGSLAERHAAPAILAHELAHLRRHDWIFLVLSRLALALFWFNPLVWRLHAVLADRSEEAADAAALETVDRTLYARTLVRLAAHPAPLAAPFAAPLMAAPRAATAMAADARTLKTRIACIMTDTSARRRPLTVALTIAALAVVATPLAALGLSRQNAVAAPAPPAPPVFLMAPAAPPATAAPMVQAVEAAPPAPPAAPAAPMEAYWHSDFRVATPAGREIAAEARARAAEARAEAAESRRRADESRIQADEAQRHAEDSRVQADIARMAAEDAHARASQAGVEGERARIAGERARQEAARHMIKARVEMAHGAEQMRKGARDMRAEAIRLRDPAYRARQIADNRARGNEVTDAELRALAGHMPSQADDMDRQADRLAAESRKKT